MNRRQALKALFGLALMGVAGGPGALRAFPGARLPPAKIGQQTLTRLQKAISRSLRVDPRSPDYMDSSTMKLWQRAMAGDSSSQSELALAYQDGDGVPEDDRLAMYWLHNAVVGGDQFACFLLGVRYDEGWGVREDPALAARLYWLGAKDRYAESEFALGECYRKGRGVPQDFSHAAYWYKRAADWKLAGFGEKECQEFSEYLR